MSSLEPSSPSHNNVVWGKTLTEFQDNFWVTKESQPLARAICGSPAE